MVNNTPRIFIGLCEIAGYNRALKAGFDELGADAQFFDLNDHAFSYHGSTVDNGFIRLIRFFDRKAADSSSKMLIRYLWMLCFLICTALLGAWALPKFDTFIFSFGKSFFRYYDLPVLKYFGKQVIFVYLGTDARPPYLNRKNYDGSVAGTIEQSRMMKSSISKVEKYADYIINHPPTGHFHQRKFVQFLKIGIPTCFSAPQPPEASPATAGMVRILHAPSHSEGKGTDRIRTAIANLEKKGYQIEYVEIMNRPNAEVLVALSRCDFVVDELYSDTIMARFAAEAAFFSKPAIVGGYAKVHDFGTLAVDEVPPVHLCAPEQVEAAIEKLILDEPYRVGLGRSAKTFLESCWSPPLVAARFLRLISNDVPADWFYDPAEIRYLHGWGLAEGQVRTALCRYLEAGGLAALQLADKPALAKRLQSFSCGEGSP